MKLIIVDHNKRFRDRLKSFLQKAFHYEIINEATDGEGLLRLENIHLADVILMDIHLLDLKGMIAAKRILWDMSHLKVIAMTRQRDLVYLEELVKAGFKACVIKNQIFEDLPAAIEKVTKGRLFYPENIRLNDNEICSFGK